MGGEIGVWSQPGQGSRFWFTLSLPVAEEATRAISARQRQHTSIAGSRVLLVEDSPVNQQVAARMLEKLGCRVALAVTGKEGIEIVQRQPLDLVFMDCEMPDLDGYETTRRIRAGEAPGQHVPIVALTAHAMKGHREQCLLAGMDDCVTKPIDMESLANAVSRWACAPSCTDQEDRLDVELGVEASTTPQAN
jgi:CheY-like chemotaxis protein